MSPAEDSDRSAGDGRDANPHRFAVGTTVFFALATAYAFFVPPASVFGMLRLARASHSLAGEWFSTAPTCAFKSADMSIANQCRRQATGVHAASTMP